MDCKVTVEGDNHKYPISPHKESLCQSGCVGLCSITSKAKISGKTTKIDVSSVPCFPKVGREVPLVIVA